jgi:hypothetical protein
MRAVALLAAVMALASCSRPIEPARGESLDLAHQQGKSCRVTIPVPDSRDGLVYSLSFVVNPCPTRAELDALYGPGNWSVKISR